ncbi:MAG: hypothetical protein OEY93_07175 [Anaerolineae bacterium]|nr:hypothetical protein [Anaerolineae bacterium]
MSHNYPLNVSFKILAMAPQMSITDASGSLIYYVKQKMLKLKEAVTVFGDQAQTQPLYKISADRIIDFSARYNFADAAGTPLGGVKRQGMQSLWKARYDIFQGDEQSPALTISEENVAVRLADGCLNQIPIVGLFAGYFLNPSYLVARPDGTGVMRISKQPALFEGKFKIDRLVELDEFEEKRILLSLIMMTLLERVRG